MKFSEGNPGLGEYAYPQHHLVYKPNNTGELDSIFPHGEEGYKQALAKAAELGNTEISYVLADSQYFDKNGQNIIPVHGKKKSQGDGVHHDIKEWQTQTEDSDRIQIAKLKVIQEQYPNIGIMVGIDGEDLSIGQRLSETDGVIHSRRVALVRANSLNYHPDLALPKDLQGPNNLALIVEQTKVGPTVSPRSKDEGRTIMGLSPDKAQVSTRFGLTVIENGLKLDPTEVLDTLKGGLRLFQQQTRIHDRDFKPRIPVTCVDPIYYGRFPGNFRTLLDSLEAQNIR